MEIFIKKAKLLTEADLSTFSNDEKLDYYQGLLSALDKKLNIKDIDLEVFEKLLEVRKTLLAKILIIKGNLK